MSEWARFSWGDLRKGKNHVTLTRKFRWNLVPLPTCASSHLESYDPKSCPKMFFPPKWSLVNAQQKKKKWGKKSNRRGEERKLLKLTFCIWNRRPRNAWNGVLGRFGYFIAIQWPEKGSTNFERCFSVKLTGANGPPGVLCFRANYLFADFYFPTLFSVFFIMTWLLHLSFQCRVELTETIS